MDAATQRAMYEHFLSQAGLSSGPSEAEAWHRWLHADSMDRLLRGNHTLVGPLGLAAARGVG